MLSVAFEATVKLGSLFWHRRRKAGSRANRRLSQTILDVFEVDLKDPETIDDACLEYANVPTQTGKLKAQELKRRDGDSVWRRPYLSVKFAVKTLGLVN